MKIQIPSGPHSVTDVDGVHLFTVTFTPKVCQALSVIDGGVLRLAIHPSTRDRMLADGLLRRDPNGVLVATERTVQVIAWAPDRDAARRGHIVHKEQKRERVQ